MKRFSITIFLLLFFFSGAFAQAGFSVATDIGLLRNMGQQQKFFTIGQTLAGNYHFTPRHSFYGWFMYFLPGKFSNEFTAVAKNPATVPQQLQYRVNASWSYRELSFGWKYYFKGSAIHTVGYNLYGMSGLGLMFSKSLNETTLDTVLYQPSSRPELGTKNFARLNLDLGLGGEIPLSYNIYLYSDIRTWINTSSYPVTVFHSDKNATLTVSLHVGVRLLFE